MDLDFGKRLMELRMNAGLSQEKLAEMIGVSRGSIYRWEAGTCLPGIKVLKKLAHVLQVDEDILLQEIKSVSSETRKAATISAPQENGVIPGIGEAISLENQEQIVESANDNETKGIQPEHCVVCKTNSMAKRVALWFGVTLSILLVAAITVILVLMHIAPPDGDGYAQSISWGLSPLDIIIVVIIWAVLVLAMIVIAVIRFLKKENNKKNSNK